MEAVPLVALRDVVMDMVAVMVGLCDVEDDSEDDALREPDRDPEAEMLVVNVFEKVDDKKLGELVRDGDEVWVLAIDSGVIVKRAINTDTRKVRVMVFESRRGCDFFILINRK
jgi:hypothetical protein